MTTYSCFDEKTALYRYFESPDSIAVNADLPVPQLPEQIGKVGVPSILSGRPLPPNARPAGRGWAARGIICRCDGGALGSFGSEGFGGGLWLLVGAAAVGAAGWYVWRNR